MPYDPNLDKNLFSKSWETDLDRLTVSVYSYNNGQKKLQISRNSRDSQGEFKFAKLGRMTKPEVEAILPLIQEAVAHLD
ncbi:MAG: hypothetical protein KJ893_07445 [Candidatus Omnitrophica bacterium]|nr:hypothetical protein [Candidatus Omnitrophota bacterium]MBU4479305.1 hypothetical protein [Candidatus Omnitrophota bacterium]MCG2704014.1 hypothetical protein [Candidatus Omnitrophota bacterium]